MKKITILSMVASAYLFAGGDFYRIQDSLVIAPQDEERIYTNDAVVQADNAQIEEISDSQFVVEANIPEQKKSDLTDGSYCAPCTHKNVGTKGRVGIIALTDDDFGHNDAFGKDTSALTSAVSLETEKSFGNVFVGGQVSATISSNRITDNRFILADGSFKTVSSAMTKGYVGAKFKNATIKAGRVDLETPLMFSEKWNLIDNTFEAVTVDTNIIPRTDVEVGFVRGFNSFSDLSTFDKVNENKGLYFISSKTKAMKELEVSTAYYLLPEAEDKNHLHAAYANVSYTGNVVSGGLQGGYIYGDSVVDNTSAVGLEVKVKTPSVDIRGAVSKVEGSREMRNIAGTKTPLYTQMEFNDMAVVGENETVLLEVGKGPYKVAYGITECENDAKYKELDLTYTKNYGNIDVLATYSNIDRENEKDNLNVIRVSAKYDF